MLKKEKSNITSMCLIREKLPDDCMLPILDYLNIKDCANLVTISKPLYQLFQPSLLKKTGFQLLRHVITGEEEKAKAILEHQEPTKLLSLLTFTEAVVDYSGRRIKGTAYQIALGAEDIEMARMMQPYFKQAYNGDEKKAQNEIKIQYDAQFPEDNKVVEKAAADLDSAELEKVIQAIHEASQEDCQSLLDRKDNKGNEETNVAKALERFRNYLDKKTERVIINGKHFNAKLLAEALGKYKADYYDFGAVEDEPRPKNNLFWRQVIGYIQRYLPACYAQAFVCYREELSRSFRFRFSSSSFFPLEVGQSGLGYDYAVRESRHPHGMIFFGPFPESSGLSPYGLYVFLQLMYHKNSEMANLRNEAASSEQRRVLAR